MVLYQKKALNQNGLLFLPAIGFFSRQHVLGHVSNRCPVFFEPLVSKFVKVFSSAGLASLGSDVSICEAFSTINAHVVLGGYLKFGFVLGNFGFLLFDRFPNNNCFCCSFFNGLYGE